MKEQIMQRLSAVLKALDTVEVRGKANYNVMSGSIALLEEISQMLAAVEISEPSSKE